MMEAVVGMARIASSAVPLSATHLEGADFDALSEGPPTRANSPARCALPARRPWHQSL
jgi:hypothetical protein